MELAATYKPKLAWIYVKRFLIAARRGAVYACLVTGLLSRIAAAVPDPSHTPIERTRTSGVLLLLTPSLGLTDLDELPSLRRLARQGSCAVMTNRVGRYDAAPYVRTEPDPLASSYLSMAAGSRAIAGALSAQLFDVGEPTGSAAARLWATHNHSRVPQAGVVAPWSALDVRQNSISAYKVPIGALGNELRKHNILSAVIGTADDRETAWRGAALFVSGSDGTAGNSRIIPGELRFAPRWAYGVRTDAEQLTSDAIEALNKYRFVVVEPGDLGRYVRYEAFTLPDARAKMRRLACMASDEIAGSLARALPDDFVMVVVSPGVVDATEMAGSDRLPLMIMFGRSVPSGLLTSGSTRRDGVVPNTDVLSTLSSAIGMDPTIGSGQSIAATPAPNNLAKLADVVQSARFQERSRRIVLIVVYLAAAVIAAGSISALLARQSGKSRYAGAAAACMFCGLLAGSYSRPEPAWLAAAALVCGAFGALLFGRIRAAGAEVLAALAVTVVATAWGSGLLVRAAGSYEILGGGRFYGIGNEHSGFLIGAMLTLAASPLVWKQKALRLAGVCFAVLMALAIGHPETGANAGDMLAALIASGVLASIWFSARPFRTAAAASVIAVVALGSVALWDASRDAASQSHLGRAIYSVRSEGPEAVGDIITRKLEMNYLLVRRSPWVWLLAAAAVGGGAMAAGLRVRKEHRARVWTIGAGMLALFVLNDSGVLAAASCGIWFFISVADGLTGINTG